MFGKTYSNHTVWLANYSIASYGLLKWLTTLYCMCTALVINTATLYPSNRVNFVINTRICISCWNSIVEDHLSFRRPVRIVLLHYVRASPYETSHTPLFACSRADFYNILSNKWLAQPRLWTPPILNRN